VQVLRETPSITPLSLGGQSLTGCTSTVWLGTHAPLRTYKDGVCSLLFFGGVAADTLWDGRHLGHSENGGRLRELQRGVGLAGVQIQEERAEEGRPAMKVTSTAGCTAECTATGEDGGMVGKRCGEDGPS